MLSREGESFAQGCSRYLDQIAEIPEPACKIYVRIVFPSGDQVTALLDTGSPYSVINQDVATQLGIDGDVLVPGVKLRTATGELKGDLVAANVTLPADEGETLCVENSKWLVSRDWSERRIVLGYQGFLEYLRIGLDGPSNLFYFGG